MDASGFQFPKDKHCYVKQELSKQTVELRLLGMLHMLVNTKRLCFEIFEFWPFSETFQYAYNWLA